MRHYFICLLFIIRQIYRPDRNWAVVGLSSWGEGCAQKGKYGVYSSLLNQEYLAWIAKKSKVVPTI
jgi:secreted trypsin-like serine protease